jgi:hypothetical protein
MTYDVFIKNPTKFMVAKKLLRRTDIKAWPEEAKEEFKILIENLIDIYGVSGFATGKAKSPFQEGFLAIKKKYHLK